MGSVPGYHLGSPCAQKPLAWQEQAMLKYSGNPPGTRGKGEGNMGFVGTLGSQAVRKTLALRSNRSLEVG